MDESDESQLRQQQAEDEKLLAAKAKLPLEEQAADKSWKVRKQAYEKMQEAVKNDASSHAQVAQLSPKAIGDGNQGAQDVACDMVLAMLDKVSSASLAPVSEELASSLVGSALGSRPAIVAKAKEALLGLVEHGFAHQVISALSKAYSHKTPKVALAAAEATLYALQQFGPGVITPKQIVPPLLKLFDAKDGKVRDVAKNCVLELSHWLGAAKVRETILPKMREAQQTELDSKLAQTADKKAPLRLTHKARAEQAAAPGASPPASPSDQPEAPAPEPAAPAVPAFSASDLDDQTPVDIAAKLPKQWSQVESIKWLERKQALTALKDLASVPRAESHNLHDIVAALKKVIQKDTNAACVAEACACVAAMAGSVRKGFATFAKGTFMPLCFDKLKDKNSAVQRQSIAAVAAMHRSCVSLKDAAESITTAMSAQNPQTRQATLKWLAEAVTHDSAAEVKKAHDGLLPQVVTLASDAVPDVRDAAIAALAAFAQAGGGMSAISKHTAKLDERRTKQLEVRHTHVICCFLHCACNQRCPFRPSTIMADYHRTLRHQW